MTDIFFSSSDEVPVPPEEVRIRVLEAEPRPDGRRINVQTEITPFQLRPNVELSIKNEAGDEVATLSVVEAIDHRMDFTMHLREAETGGEYQLTMQVFYADVDQHGSENGERAAGEIIAEASRLADERQVSFEIPTE